MSRCIYIYNDEGVSELCVADLEAMLRECVKTYEIRKITAEDVIKGEWRKNSQCALFVMPGGRDLPYLQRLKGHGIDQIRKYIFEDGGSYLGICAGAYFAASDIEFSLKTSLEVIGHRPLQLYPGTAKGPFLGAGYSYTDESVGEAAANCSIVAEGNNLSAAAHFGLCEEQFKVYYNGGCFFVAKDEKVTETTNIRNLVSAKLPERDDTRNVIVYGETKSKSQQNYGRFILSGLHFEHGFSPSRNQKVKTKVEAECGASAKYTKSLIQWILSLLL